MGAAPPPSSSPSPLDQSPLPFPSDTTGEPCWSVVDSDATGEVAPWGRVLVVKAPTGNPTCGLGSSGTTPQGNHAGVLLTVVPQGRLPIGNPTWSLGGSGDHRESYGAPQGTLPGVLVAVVTTGSPVVTTGSTCGTIGTYGTHWIRFLGSGTRSGVTVTSFDPNMEVFLKSGILSLNASLGVVFDGESHCDVRFCSIPQEHTQIRQLPPPTLPMGSTVAPYAVPHIS